MTIVYTNNNRFDEQSRRRIRAHAGRWSQAHRSNKKRSLSFRSATKPSNPFPDSSVPRRIKKANGKPLDQSSKAAAARLRSSATLSRGLFLGSNLDAFRTLPQLPLEKARPDALSVAKSHMSTVLGEGFVRETINAGQSTAMYVGSLLITYARHYALTGKLMGPDLLELKAEVIKIINTDLRTGIGLESLYAMFVLGAPVVCLTTTLLPSSDAARKSLFAAQHAASVGAVEDSLAKELALRDHFLHRQTVMRILLDMGPTKLRQAKIGRKFLAFYILCVSRPCPHQSTNRANRLGNMASLGSSLPPVFDESDLYPPPRVEDQVNTSPIWHSPLYCPSGMYIGARKPRSSTEAFTAELCWNLHSWLETFEGDDGEESEEESMIIYRQHCRHAIELCQPCTGSPSHESVHVYECCRLVAHLMLQAEASRCSLREAAQGGTCLVQIDHALQKTNLFDLWGPQIGLLYWVLLVSCTSVADNSFNLNPTTVLLNFLIGKIATSDYHVEVGLRPLQRLKRFNDICRREP